MRKRNVPNARIQKMDLEKVTWLAEKADNPEWREMAKNELHRRSLPPPEPGLKHCRFCDEWLEVTEFDLNNQGQLKRYCRGCNHLRREPRN